MSRDVLNLNEILMHFKNDLCRRHSIRRSDFIEWFLDGVTIKGLIEHRLKVEVDTVTA